MKLDTKNHRLTPDSFKDNFIVGSIITMRNINKQFPNIIEGNYLYSGWSLSSSGLFLVFMGCRVFTLEELFNEWEYYDELENKWKRFSLETV